MKIYKQKSKPWITEQHFQFNPSFGPYVRFLTQKMEQCPDIRVKFYRYLIKKFQQQPSLIVPFKNVKILEEHDDLVQLLMMSLLPLSSNPETYPIALAFLQPSCFFYYTSTFKETFINEHIEFNTKEDEVSNLKYFVKLVLEKCYHIKTDDNHKIIKLVKNEAGKTVKHLQLVVESSFIEVHVKKPLPDLHTDWFKMLSADADFLEAFTRFPSHKFRLEGFCMVTIEDVSKEMAITGIKNAIINMHTISIDETVNLVELSIGELINDARIKIGITPFYKLNGKIVYDNLLITKGVGISSIEKGIKKGVDINETYQKLSENPNPYIFSNIDKDFVSSRASISDLGSEQMKNYLVFPIFTKRDGLLGLFELEKENITTKIIDSLQPAIPLITDLLYYMIDILDYKINRIVKEKFTPIQPSVEWKFNEAAWHMLRNSSRQTMDDAPTEEIVFPQVHPLYGAIDIRDSSIKRNLALRNDHITQLEATIELLDKTAGDMELPLLESIRFKCKGFIESTGNFLSAEKEIEIMDFFENEVFVFFKYLMQRHPRYKDKMEEYFKKTERSNGFFYTNQNAYEESSEKVNRKIVEYLEEEIRHQQLIYPFYFEKYRTDGVEYNIYIGQSIVASMPFDPIYVKNLKLWQLTTMARIAQLNFQMQETLPLSLLTTQLILVQTSAIDICFRKDERRFDVEGSYNIRYEILKKRIDKAVIKGSGERLTQPHKVAIVYTNTAEVTVYLQHIRFLQNMQLLNGEIEKFEVEDLQGVSGLKALRVGVNYNEINIDDTNKLTA